MLDSHQQEGFAQSLAYGVAGRPLTESDAYRINYDAGNMQDKTIHEAASRLANDSKVAARVKELKTAIQDRVTADAARNVDWQIETSVDNLRGAQKDRQWAAANGALTNIGKLTGTMVERKDINVTHTIKPGMTLEELEASIPRLEALEARITEADGYKVIPSAE